MTMEVQWGLAIGLAYLVGSIPFGLVIGRAKGVDLRKVGSGNIGATNCGRVLGRKFGIACFFLDLLKGFAPVFTAGWAMGMIGREPVERWQEWAWLGVASAAVLGHIFPIWLGFRGGKGVATGLGVILGVWPHLALPAVGAMVIFAIMVAMFRYVGLASVVAAVCLPGLAAGLAAWRDRSLSDAAPYLVVTSAMALLIVWRHRGNLARTWKGTESRVGGKRDRGIEA